MLYWCGIREGELLALTPGDFNFKAGTVSINKSYQRLHGEDVITTPKTKKSIHCDKRWRVIMCTFRKLPALIIPKVRSSG